MRVLSGLCKILKCKITDAIGAACGYVTCEGNYPDSLNDYLT